MESMIEYLYKAFLKYQIVSIDSRNIPEGSIFFALKGENFNGNRFALEALKKGAALAIVDENIPGINDQVIRVNNVLETLQILARFHREKLGLKVIGITGSNGKTTTKELTQSVLKKKYNSYATIGNLNNHIGVPLTILSLNKDHEIAVVEMGANHVGEIAQLCEIAVPDFGIITNIGKAHLEGFGGFEGVVKAKTELYDFIRNSNGKIFVNSDNKLLIKNAQSIKAKTYGVNEAADCRGKLHKDFPFLELSTTIEDTTINLRTKLIGAYNFENILAAICIGQYFKVPISSIKEAIEAYQPTNNRSQIIQTSDNTLILDAYNANPSSMRAAINNFAAGDFENKVLILGDMAELGVESSSEHIAILEFVKSNGLSNVMLIGPEFMKANQSYGYTAIKNKAELEHTLRMRKLKNATILIKGSRRMELEKITSLL